MLSPEPMRHVSVVVLSADLERTTRAIARIGVLHLLNVRDSVETLAAIRPYDVSERLAQVERLARAVSALQRYFELAPPEAVDAEVEGGGLDLADVERRVASITLEVDALRQQQTRAADDCEQLRKLSRNLRVLAPLGLPLGELRRLRYVFLTSGLLPERNLPRLRDSLARLPHLIVPISGVAADARLLLVVVCLRAGQETLERALRSAQFERLELPAHLSGTAENAIADVDAQLRAARDLLAGFDTEKAAAARRLAPELRTLRGLVERERVLVAARGFMGQSERISLVSGWVPAVVAPPLEYAIRDATAGRCVVQWQDPAAVDGVRRGHIPVPILLHNPVWIRPFEHVLRGYGMPRYGEVDPTPVVALAFLAMFGFMFGDVGQGAVLFAIGYFIYRRMFRYRDYALILMECGVSAVAFGFLYGSIFGVEHWLPALWLRPLEDMTTLMQTAIVFGMSLLSLGLLLNVVNAVRRRDPEALWERNGVLAAMAYWIAVGLVIRRLTAGPGAVTLGATTLWLAAPMLLILLKDPVRALWRGRRQGQRPGLGELFVLVVQSLVEVVDTVVSSISNTATFIRLAAFALSHAGLFLATFSVADAVARAGGGPVGVGIVLVVGNAVIIGLEGLIVSIQTVRLEYYEFFSKFYSGGGEEYRPLRLAEPQARGV